MTTRISRLLKLQMLDKTKNQRDTGSRDRSQLNLSLVRDPGSAEEEVVTFANAYPLRCLPPGRERPSRRSRSRSTTGVLTWLRWIHVSQ